MKIQKNIGMRKSSKNYTTSQEYTNVSGYGDHLIEEVTKKNYEIFQRTLLPLMFHIFLSLTYCSYPTVLLQRTCLLPYIFLLQMLLKKILEVCN